MAVSLLLLLLLASHDAAAGGRMMAAADGANGSADGGYVAGAGRALLYQRSAWPACKILPGHHKRHQGLLCPWARSCRSRPPAPLGTSLGMVGRLCWVWRWWLLCGHRWVWKWWLLCGHGCGSGGVLSNVVVVGLSRSRLRLCPRVAQSFVRPLRVVYGRVYICGRRTSYPKPSLAGRWRRGLSGVHLGIGPCRLSQSGARRHRRLW